MTGQHPLYKFFLKFADLPEAEWSDFAPNVREIRIDKASYYIQAGDDPTEVALVHKGLFKRFYTLADGKEHNQLFAAENEWIGSYSAAIRGEKSPASIQALEDSLVYSFPVQKFRERFDLHPAWERIGRISVEALYMEREKHQYELLMLAAKERTESIIGRMPNVSHRLANKDLATYIGITPESLSRIKKQLL